VIPAAANPGPPENAIGQISTKRKRTREGILFNNFEERRWWKLSSLQSPNSAAIPLVLRRPMRMYPIRGGDVSSKKRIREVRKSFI